MQLLIDRATDLVTELLSNIFFRSRFALAAKLLLPLALLLGLFVLPLLFVFQVSFWELEGMDMVPALSLENYTYFLSEPVYQSAILQSVQLALLVAALCLLLGYPLALILTQRKLRFQSIITFVLITPLFVSVVIRVFGWIALLESNGLINTLLKSLGIIDKPIVFMNSLSGVTIGLVNVYLVFMVISLVASLAGIPPSLREAAQTLGASRWRVWWHITLPLSAPGVLAGFVLVFALAISSFIEPRIIGGSRFLVVPIQVFQEVMGALNWPLGAAMGFVLLGVSLTASAIAFLAVRLAFPHLRTSSGGKG